MNKKLFVVFVSIVGISLLFAGCGSRQEAQATTQKVVSGVAQTAGQVSNELTNPNSGTNQAMTGAFEDHVVPVEQTALPVPPTTTPVSIAPRGDGNNDTSTIDLGYKTMKAILCNSGQGIVKVDEGVYAQFISTDQTGAVTLKMGTSDTSLPYTVTVPSGSNDTESPVGDYALAAGSNCSSIWGK